jgi:hypothetical protein
MKNIVFVIDIPANVSFDASSKLRNVAPMLLRNIGKRGKETQTIK